MSFADLKNGFHVELKRIETNLKAFPWENPQAYGNWCAQTYYYVSHSTRLLALSAARIPLPMVELYSRYLQHLQEEKGHENLCLRDLAKLGFPLEDFPEQAVTASFYQTQYYYIEHVHPCALFGYILILEGLSAKYGKECYLRARKAHGKEATNFWRVHAEEDPDHVDKAFAQIQTLDKGAFAPILRNLQDSCARYGELLDSSARTAQASLRREAA